MTLYWMNRRPGVGLLPLVAALVWTDVALAAEGDGELGFEMTRMVAHWDAYGDPDYLAFIEEAGPEVAQVGFYGAHFWSLVHTPEFGGYPAHFPVRGLEKCAEWFRTLNSELHQRGVKVVGHFNIEFLIGDPRTEQQEARGFFHWYENLWDEAVLGPKPVEDPVEFLEKQADGSPIVNESYGIGGMKEYWACLRNPAWQAVLKTWVKRGIELGVDGFMVNYFYRHDCRCERCEAGFRDYLRRRFSPDELRERFGIAGLETHAFDEIVSWHDPASTSPLRLEMLRFSQVSNKAVFDEVFLAHGRSLKPDLIVGQWNHLGDFDQISGDERCLLPGDLWAKGESYLWYSAGGAANFSDLENGNPGDATLQARFIRGASGDKPFTVGKYEATRIRSAIAELAANGGVPMGFYTRFGDPAAREVIVRYYRFLEQHESLYRNSRPHSEAALLFPRSKVHAGDVAAVEKFRRLGRALLDEHVLFDVLPDDMLAEAGGRYGAVITAESDPAELISKLPPDRSRFEAPFAVRVSASRPAGSEREIDVHFVNYNRVEPPRDGDGRPAAGGGIEDEKPVASGPVAVDLALPAGARVDRVEFLTPEAAEPVELPWPSSDGNGRIRFSTPGFLVYGVARVLILPPSGRRSSE